MSEKKNPKIFEWPIRIYYEDTDCGGIVYHANYLKFFERARTEILRLWNINQHTLMEQCLAFVVRSMELEFKRGAKLDDALIVRTHIERVKSASLVFIQRLEDAEGQLYCQAKVNIAAIDPTKMKPQIIPPAIATEMKSVC